MIITIILSLALAIGLSLIAVIISLALIRPREYDEGNHDEGGLELSEDEELFDGWDKLSAAERKQRLALYQRRIRARIAEQERAWLQERLRECAKG